MSDIDNLRDSFYQVTVEQRNTAWREVETLKQEKAALEGELRSIDAVLARRPALDKPTRRENIEHAIATAARMSDRVTVLEREKEQAEATTRRWVDDYNNLVQRAAQQMDAHIKLKAESQASIDRLAEENKRLREALEAKDWQHAMAKDAAEQAYANIKTVAPLGVPNLLFAPILWALQRAIDAALTGMKEGQK